jgi:hypothetical protein
MTGLVERDGDTVRRPMKPWSPSVHDLLRHLESVGFAAPRVLDVEGDTEVLTWIDGDSGADGWRMVVPEDGLARWGRFLREYHEAVAGYVPAAGTPWSSGAAACGPGEIVCHGDFGPWNAVWRDGEVVALLDWDHARPAPPFFDVAYALEYAAPFRDDEECVRSLSYPGPPDRRRRIEVFCDAYGVSVPDDVAARVAAQQRTVLATFEALAARGLEPQASCRRDGNFDAIRARIRWTEALAL